MCAYPLSAYIEYTDEARITGGKYKSLSMNNYGLLLAV